MKFRILYITLAGLFLAGTFYNFQGGPAAAQGADFTGSPLSPNGAFCSMCHGAGAFSPSLEIMLLSNGAPVDKYTPGETYQLEIAITAMDMPGGYGFQAVALDGANASQGTFGTPPTDMRLSDVNGVQYLEHGIRMNENKFTVDWTAPDASAGDVIIYAAGIAADGTNSNAGDGAANSSLTLESTSSTNDVNDSKFDLTLLSNPVNDVLPIRINSSQPIKLEAKVLDLNGRAAISQNFQVMQGEQVVSIEAGALNPGIYFLQLFDGESVTTKKMLKL